MTSGKVKRGIDVIQRHHLIYQKEKDFSKKIGPVVLIYKGEHWAISQLQRRKKISKGFLEALRYWINQVEASAVELKLDS